MAANRRRPVASWIPSLAAAVGVLVVLPVPAHGADARDRDVLSIGVTEDERAALWPVELSLALEATRRGPAPLAPRTMVVREGSRMVFDEAVWTDRGLERFSLVVTPRHHAGGTVEIEWELAVWYQPYALRADAESWRTYLLYRAGLGPRPPLERPQLVAVRADIVECRGGAVLESIRVAGRDYALRIAARSTRPVASPG